MSTYLCPITPTDPSLQELQMKLKLAACESPQAFRQLVAALSQETPAHPLSVDFSHLHVNDNFLQECFQGCENALFVCINLTGCTEVTDIGIKEIAKLSAITSQSQFVLCHY